MAGVLKRIWKTMSGDLLGREEVIEKDHPLLGHIVYFGRKDLSDGYWEAELAHPSLPKKFSVTLPGGKTGPEHPQVEFVRSTLDDLEALFELCRASFQREYSNRTKAPWPQDWRSAFVLDGFEVPERGDRNNKWHVCYFVQPTNRYFTAHFENGRVSGVIVDG